MTDPTLDRVLKVVSTAVPADTKVEPTTALLDQNLIDSMGLLILVGALDEEFGIHLDTDDLTIQNFATPTTIATMVNRYDPK